VSPDCAGAPLPLTMSTTVSLAGGLPDGLGIFGFFLVSVPIAFASFRTAAVGLAKVGGFAGLVVVVCVVEVPVSGPPLGMSAVFVLPQAASPMQATASAGHATMLLRRITGGHLTSRSSSQPMPDITSRARR
jgi:hypothetical protein